MLDRTGAVIGGLQALRFFRGQPPQRGPLQVFVKNTEAASLGEFLLAHHWEYVPPSVDDQCSFYFALEDFYKTAHKHEWRDPQTDLSSTLAPSAPFTFRILKPSRQVIEFRLCLTDPVDFLLRIDSSKYCRSVSNIVDTIPIQLVS